jgi:Caenorhabditis protein of unknown function, DUF268
LLIKTVNYYLNLFGFYPKKFVNSLKGLLPFFQNYYDLKNQIKTDTKFAIKKLHPCLDDRFDTAGSIPLHYFHQDLHIANKIFINNPQKHIDIGSRVDGFVAHVASFREIEVFDIRKLNDKIKNVKFVQADLMNDNFIFEEYTDSVSCLHAIEHFGLGRYGDKVNINGHAKGLDNIYKLLKKNGKFYFSTPIGPQRIEFDAHRVFSLRYLLEIFEGKYLINTFSYINDKNILFENVELSPENIENNFNCIYGCGIFEMTKL